MKASIAVLVLAALGLGGAFLLRPQGDADDILLSAATAAPLEEGGAAIFLTVENRGTPDRIISVSSPLGDVSLYSPEAEDGIPAPSGLSASLAADGAHLRLSGLSTDLQYGQLIPLSLRFEEAGEVTTKARLIDPQKQGGAQEVGLFGLGDICRVGEGEPAPKIALSVHEGVEGWRIRVEAEEFEFSKDFAGLYHVPGMGHGHLYVGGMKLERLYSNEASIGALPKGRHVVRVTLNTNDHRAYVVDDAPVTAMAVIEVD
ncbi:copper chaperone PCu(A)C [Thalassococcus sp. S3]|uniref:copper chaperone PCu(A)C n=1 Tax=Thalassococcus sp. S3 TaxID=2017482 RepID=UPI00102474C8|nr:copper chaperone PCu(A)C [Thalassococcus sp. S3]QBF32020.1 hypothetical protein CFI11_12420 [Thalassococcus sp. S3]